MKHYVLKKLSFSLSLYLHFRNKIEHCTPKENPISWYEIFIILYEMIFTDIPKLQNIYYSLCAKIHKFWDPLPPLLSFFSCFYFLTKIFVTQLGDKLAKLLHFCHWRVFQKVSFWPTFSKLTVDVVGLDNDQCCRAQKSTINWFEDCMSLNHMTIICLGTKVSQTAVITTQSHPFWMLHKKQYYDSC